MSHNHDGFVGVSPLPSGGPVFNNRANFPNPSLQSPLLWNGPEQGHPRAKERNDSCPSQKLERRQLTPGHLFKNKARSIHRQQQRPWREPNSLHEQHSAAESLPSERTPDMIDEHHMPTTRLSARTPACPTTRTGVTRVGLCCLPLVLSVASAMTRAMATATTQRRPQRRL
jgi:hypothetical protein